MGRYGIRSLALVAACIGVAMVLAYALGRGETSYPPGSFEQVGAAPAPLDEYDIARPSRPAVTAQEIVPQSAQQMSLSFAPVVRGAAPAVTNIYTRKIMQPRYADPMLEMLFGSPYGGQAEPQTSLGSGVIVDPNGVVLTNAHVIEGADEITVALSDRREFSARVLLVDSRTDLAVLKIEARDLPVLEFRDSDTMEVGDLVLAIGNPFGVGQTVTTGIISAQARSAEDGRVFIQTDAAINPGNSGGALVDMTGRLIGINTMIVSPSGGSNGIGFAIPADLARQAVESAGAGSATVARAWLGIDGQAVTPEIADSLGLARPSGVILSQLHPGSSLREAGLRAGDVVVDVEGLAVTDLASLDYRLGTGRLGETLPVGYVRDGARREVAVRLISAPENPPRDLAEIGGRSPLAGIMIANANPALAQERGLSPAISGVVVLETGRSYAARYGLQPGDLLREINGVQLRQVTDVEAALSRARGYWSIAIEREGRLLRLDTRG